MVLKGVILGHTTSMKLLIATGLYAPEIGGPATYTAFLERHLPQHGVLLTVVPFAHVRKYPRFVRHLLYTYQILREGRNVDLLYALDTVSVGVPAWIASIVLRKPLYLRVPGDYAWEQGQQRFGVRETLDEYHLRGTRPFVVGVLAWLQSAVARGARKVIVPSEYLKRIVTKWGVPEHRISVIHSAYNPVLISESRDELRARFGYEGFVVLTAGRLVPWKGMSVLIDAVAELRGRGILVSLDIVGDGTLANELSTQVRERGAETYVHLRGREEKTVLGERVKAADVFVLNTSYEGLSHQLLEVMDIGTPIITTAVGGNPEIIADGETGLFVPFNGKEEIVNALESIRLDTALRLKIIERARERIHGFEEEKVVQKLMEVLHT